MTRLGWVAASLVACAVLAPARPPSAAAATADLVQCGFGETAWATQAPFALSRLGVPDAWEVARGRGVVVAVVDSGVEADNAHLRGAVGPGVSLVPGDPEPGGTGPVNNHGTAVASLIAARAVEGSALVGVAPEATIMPVRVFASEDPIDGQAGNGLRADRLAAGIRWAVDNGADIVNVAISAPSPDPALEDAVRHAADSDVLVVASVGNRLTAGDDSLRWPAAYDGVLGVTATTTNDDVTDASIGGEAVDVAAPGQDVISAWFDQRDCVNSPGDQAPQTSWSTGYVSGVAALVASARPDASAEEVAYRIAVTADRPIRSRRDDRRGWGLVQPLLAMTTELDPALAGPPPPAGLAVAAPQPSAEAIHVAATGDPAAGTRRDGVWWALLGAAAAAGLALARVRQRSRR
ncbi:MAG: S8 family serine peptidase [Kineosporiaceae bacterium]